MQNSNNKAIEKSAKTQPTTRKCALHPVNFPDEEQIRDLSEFYDPRSSYCKACMKIHHKARRERILAGENREKNLYNEFAEKLIAVAKIAIEFSDQEAQDLFAKKSLEALMQLRENLSK